MANHKHEAVVNMGATVEEVANWADYEAANAVDKWEEHHFTKIVDLLEDITKRRKIHAEAALPRNKS